MKRTLSLTALAKYIGWSRATIYNKIENGDFPVAPIKGTNPRRWLVDDIDAWLKGDQ